MCSDFFLYDLLFLLAIRHIVCKCGGRSAQCDAQHCAAKDIGGEVHIEVQPGKGDKGCQHQRGRATSMVMEVLRSQGRGRANSGLRKKCPAAMYSTSATAMAKPALRVRRKSRSSRVNAIQISP